MNSIRRITTLLFLIIAAGSGRSFAAPAEKSSPASIILDNKAGDVPGEAPNVSEAEANSSEDEAHSSDIANGKRFIQAPMKYPLERPCEYGEKDLQSDLCAQWYAAKGATDGAVYAMVGAIIGGLSTFLVVASLYYARRGTALAADAVSVAKNAIEIAKIANIESARANELAAEAHRLAISDFDERMRPRCAVIGINLVERWIDVAKTGNPVPMTISVESLGAQTSRHLLIEIDRLQFIDQAGNVVGGGPFSLHLAPLRAGQSRVEEMLIRPMVGSMDVKGISIRGRIGSIGDLLVVSGRELQMVEEFSWRENPLNRSSPRLVECAPGYDRENEGDDTCGLPLAALGANT